MTKTNTTISKPNPNADAIIKVLNEHKGEWLSFNEIARFAGVEPRTGYLTAVKKRVNIETWAKNSTTPYIVKETTVRHYKSGDVSIEKDVAETAYRLAE